MLLSFNPTKYSALASLVHFTYPSEYFSIYSFNKKIFTQLLQLLKIPCQKGKEKVSPKKSEAKPSRTTTSQTISYTKKTQNKQAIFQEK